MNDDENVYVGRNGRVFIGSVKKNNRRIFHFQKSIWHNPYKVSVHGLEDSLLMYDKYIREQIEKEPETFDLDLLRGKTLGCWCKPNKCHGDVLVRILNERNIGVLPRNLSKKRKIESMSYSK